MTNRLVAELDSDTKEFLLNSQNVDSERISIKNIDEIRRVFKQTVLGVNLPEELKVSSSTKQEDIIIPGPHGFIPARVYKPTQLHKDVLSPVVVFFHGGGWVLGDIDTYDDTLSYLSIKSDAIVLSIGYRLAPEHQFPVPFEDCYAAFSWVYNNIQRLGGDPERLCIAGDSAGGNLAAAVCHLSKRQRGPGIARQILIYPVLEAPSSLNYSKELYGNGDYILSNEDMSSVLSLYARQEEDLSDYRLFPALADDFSDLPETLIIAAECDILLAEGQHYAEKLDAAGIIVEHQLYKGTVHGFVTFAGVINQGVQALDNIADYIRAISI